MTAEEVIAALQLEPHPLEGGFFRETYRSRQKMPNTDRVLSTAIYYLLTPHSISKLHRLATDEMFHFYLGDPVEQLQLWPDGRGEIVTLGADLARNQRPQVLVPSGVWQGATLAPGGRIALLGTTMTPGFAYPDYESADENQLSKDYPQFADFIRRLRPD